MNEIKGIRKSTGLTQRAFAERYHIPLDTLRKWEANLRKPPFYVLELLSYRVEKEKEEKK